MSLLEVIKCFFVFILVRPWKSNDGPSKPPEINEPEKGQTHISGKIPLITDTPSIQN